MKLDRSRRRRAAIFRAKARRKGTVEGDRTAAKEASMRDFAADWRKWSHAERLLAVTLTLMLVAVPLGLLTSEAGTWPIKVLSSVGF
jgi:hypothetical protein